MGRVEAAYHTPGAEITGSDVNHNEKVITVNDLLVSSVFLSNIEEAKNHWDVKVHTLKKLEELWLSKKISTSCKLLVKHLLLLQT